MSILEFEERADALWYGDMWSDQANPEAIRRELASALRAEYISALEWALDAFMGGDYDEQAFGECEESVKARIAELKAQAADSTSKPR